MGGKMGNSNQQYKEIGNRINTLLSSQDEGLTNIDIYNKIFGDDKKSDSAKKNKISDLRAGRKISIDDLMLISSFFDVSLDWLVYGKEHQEKVDAVKTTYKALTAISEFAQIEIDVQPMTKESNCTAIYTPYKINIGIMPKIYEQHDECWEYPGYVPTEYDREWYYYMDIDNYKLAWLLYLTTKRKFSMVIY